MDYNLLSLTSTKLGKDKIIQINKLKDSQWKFGLKSQTKWFKKNIKKNDIHNLFYIKSKLIGYTLLRRRTYNLNNNKRKKKYILFDTLVIHKNYRNKKISRLLMVFNNTIIRETGLFSFLICKKKLINFYIKNNWIKLDKKNIKVMDHTFSSNGMLFNINSKHKYCFYLNK